MLLLARNTHHDQKVAVMQTMHFATHFDSRHLPSGIIGTKTYENGKLTNNKFTYTDKATYTPQNAIDNAYFAVKRSAEKIFKRNGKGTYSDKTGNTYVGTWKDDNPENVTLTYEDKSTYTGGLDLDLNPDGKGIMTKNGTTTIKGFWKNGEPDLTKNFTILDEKAKTEYIGKVNREFKRNGAGLFDDGTTTIEGFWKNGEPDLTKNFTIDEGEDTEYTGIINSQLKKHGKGIMTKNVTTTIEGFWKNGEPDLTKEFTILDDEAKTEYTGIINREFKLNGAGLFDNGSMTVYGNWKDGKPDLEGIFTIIYKEKSRYVGNINDKFERNGQGEFFNAKGKSLGSGVWTNGRLPTTPLPPPPPTTPLPPPPPTTPRKRDVNVLPP